MTTRPFAILPVLAGASLFSATAAAAVLSYRLLSRRRRLLWLSRLDDDEDEGGPPHHDAASGAANRLRSSQTSGADDEADADAGEDEAEQNDPEPSHSILRHFRALTIRPGSTVEESNKRRTAAYYEKAREAHLQELVPGVRSKSTLLQRRRAEMERIMRHWYGGAKKSHRTVVVMCDCTTAGLLDEARGRILQPLNPTSDPTSSAEDGACWIPEVNIIPPSDMHVTVATPWWWHTIRPNNWALSRELGSRLRQTLLLKFHHPFQIELERIVLLGGKTLVALWRTVGERTAVDDDDVAETETADKGEGEEGEESESSSRASSFVIYDRHGEREDPFVRLREEIVRCFTTESPDGKRMPLTYVHKVASKAELHGAPPTPQQEQEQKGESSTKDEEGAEPKKANAGAAALPAMDVPKPGKLKRQHTIEKMTPGLGTGDGFIHTTLARLPLSCLSRRDVELGEVHRLCREATATLAGHRMVVSKYRLLETTGRGGESNPCVEPLYDETIKAPNRMTVEGKGGKAKRSRLHDPNEIKVTSTIGAPERNFSAPISMAARHGRVDGLFHPPPPHTQP